MGNDWDGSQAEYIRIHHAQPNMCLIPDEMTSEAAVLVADIMSTGMIRDL